MADRDTKGRWLKGHQFTKTTGIKSGRKKTIAGKVRDALAIAEDAMPEIIEQMIARAKNPEDKESQRAAEYLIDRIYGKARQALDARVESIESIAVAIIREERPLLIIDALTEDTRDGNQT